MCSPSSSTKMRSLVGLHAVCKRARGCIKSFVIAAARGSSRGTRCCSLQDQTPACMDGDGAVQRHSGTELLAHAIVRILPVYCRPFKTLEVRCRRNGCVNVTKVKLLILVSGLAQGTTRKRRVLNQRSRQKGHIWLRRLQGRSKSKISVFSIGSVFSIELWDFGDPNYEPQEGTNLFAKDVGTILLPPSVVLHSRYSPSG